MTTSKLCEPVPGNLRVDYVLARKGLNVVGSGIFWPESDDPTFGLVAASDHRLTWIDVRNPRFRG